MTLARLLASGFGSGLVPRAPGTAGSLAAALLGVVLLMLSPWALACGVALACVAGWWAIPRAGGDHDPGWVVVDEFAGMWIAMLALPAPHWPWVVGAFVLFRLFDILKPGPVDWVQRWPGALGVMADDVLAGAAAAACLALAGMVWRHMGGGDVG